MEKATVQIRTEFIKLQDLLKFAGAVETGGDAKLIAVPTNKILPIYKHWNTVEDIAPERLAQIQHFFEHYKDLEKGKWVKVKGWEGPVSARAEVRAGIANWQATHKQ